MGDGLGLSDLPGINFDEHGPGMITPKPQATDDSELGYLAGGASGNASGELVFPYMYCRWR